MIEITKEILQARENNYSIVANRMAYYYKEVLNIEIINLFYKNKGKKALNFDDKKIKFNFKILIKDNNKKFFKYKILETTFDLVKYYQFKHNKFSEPKTLEDWEEILYYFIDNRIVEYCKEKYFQNSDKLEEIMKKNDLINQDYQRWLLDFRSGIF